MAEENGRTRFIAKKGPQYFAALAATLGGFQLGLVNGWTSPGLPDLDETEDLGKLTTDEKAWMASLASLACFFAVYPSAFTIRKFGRQPVMIIISVPFVLGWLVMTFASTVGMMYVGRFITGFCSGTFSIAAPVFIAEFSEPSIRGTLGSGFQLMIVTGILFCYAFGAFLSWQWLALVSAIPAIVCLVMLIFVPESPRYLIGLGKFEEAKTALMWFRGANFPNEVADEFKLIQVNVEENRESGASFRDIFTPSILKPSAIAVILLMFQQLCGIDAVTFFTVDIFKDAGSSMDPNTATIIVGVVQVISNIIAALLVDKVGRRIMLLVSNVILVITLAALGAFFFIQSDDPSEEVKVGWLPLVSLVIYVSAFSFGIGPIAWMMVGEMIPNQFVEILSPVATSVLWMLSFLITRFFENVVESIGQEACFWFFAASTAVGTVFVFFFLPETQGKTLDEVQEYFNGRKQKDKVEDVELKT